MNSEEIPQRRQRTLKALIVEDSEPCAAVMCDMIRHAGFDLIHDVVVEEQPMREALLSRRWDVVISDNHLPRFSGTAALGVVKELTPTTPFILVTSAPCPVLFNRLLSSGAWGCYDKMEIYQVVKLLGDRFNGPTSDPEVMSPGNSDKVENQSKHRRGSISS